MRQESVSTYPRRPKAEAFSNAVDVVERLHDPTDPTTERMEPHAKPVVDHQRRLNPKMKEVVRMEILKLLEAGIIYLLGNAVISKKILQSHKIYLGDA